MILAVAVVLGLAGSIVRHRRDTLRQIAAIPLRSAWLVLLAIVMQWPLLWAAAGPVHRFRVQQTFFFASYILLLAFVWYNRRLVTVLLIGVGLVSNFLVIAANGGFMAITPQTLTQINPGTTVEQWPVGDHYGRSKDVIETRDQTKLWALSDVLVLPSPFPWPTAFSVGDVTVAAGIVGLLQGRYSKGKQLEAKQK